MAIGCLSDCCKPLAAGASECDDIRLKRSFINTESPAGVNIYHRLKVHLLLHQRFRYLGCLLEVDIIYRDETYIIYRNETYIIYRDETYIIYRDETYIIYRKETLGS